METAGSVGAGSRLPRRTVLAHHLLPPPLLAKERSDRGSSVHLALSPSACPAPAVAGPPLPSSFCFHWFLVSTEAFQLVPEVGQALGQAFSGCLRRTEALDPSQRGISAMLRCSQAKEGWAGKTGAVVGPLEETEMSWETESKNKQLCRPLGVLPLTST